MAGFEWGTGFHVNPVPPEQAAAFLREFEVESQEPQDIPTSEAG
jgi:UDPglucose--hexose-1-phosphate uridylyltransferase